MHTVIETLGKSIFAALAALKIPAPAELHFEHPTNSSFGDYSSNVAMVILGKKSPDKNAPKDLAVSKYNSPRELAEAIVGQLQLELANTQNLDIQQIAVAGPGFINFTLSSTFFINAALKSVKPGETDGLQQLKHKKIIVEFTDPNPFKEFHIGHLYSNVVGESICRLLAKTGAEVQRVCYQGDVGMHVAKSVWGLKQKLIAEKLTLSDLEKKKLQDRLKFLGQAYALGATKFEEEESAKKEMQEINYMCYVSAQEFLEETLHWQPQINYAQYLTDTHLDYAEIKQLYQSGRAWSLAYFNEIYARLGMKFDDFYFESIVGEFGVKIVKEFLEKKVFEKSQGAVIFPGSKYGLHDRVFINSLGLPTYECKELGLAPEKFRRFPYDESIIITGNEIDEYFKVLLMALQQVSPELAAKTRHVSHGMVRLPEGKMSSRTGKVLTGEWLIEEAQKKVTAIFEERKNVSLGDERAQAIEAVTLGAIKYALLKHDLGSNIAFSFEESLNFQGNSGPYLQYTYARCRSVLSKSAENSQTNKLPSQPNLKNGEQNLFADYAPNLEETAVLRMLYRFNEVVQLATRELAPHYVATYLFELAQAYNAFYNKHSILGKQGEVTAPDTVALRLVLTQATAELIKKGLQLLGIQTLEKM